MTSTTSRTPVPAPAIDEASSLEAAATPRRRARRDLGPIRPAVLERIGGIGLIAGPLLHAAGMATSPVQTEPGTAGYIASLAADPALSLLSANLLHYGWVAFAIGAVAGRGLLRGPQGRVWLGIAAAVLLLGSIQMSGLLLSDWFLVSAGNVLTMDQAVLMDTTAKEWSVGIWQMTGMIGGLGGLMAYSLGLARAGAISWWIAPLGGLAWFAPMFVSGVFVPVLVAVLMIPFLIAGGRLLLAR